MEYLIKVEEVLRDVWKIKAENLEEALNIAADLYYGGREMRPDSIKEVNFSKF